MIRTMAMRRRALPHCAYPFAPHLLSASLRRNCNDVFFFNPTPYCLAPERLTRLTHNTPRYTISSFSLLCQQTANANSVDIAQGETPKSVTPKHDRAQLLLLTTLPPHPAEPLALLRVLPHTTTVM
jgi:hypothetical protein